MKQVDDKLAALILGNAQTQVYFRVGRQDAERLAKESANIIAQLIEQVEEPPLIQEVERKFSMMELWEAAFHQLARLEPRKAYVMVKGAMEHPELIRTMENVMGKSVRFPCSECYVKLDELMAVVKHRGKDIVAELESYFEKRREDQGRGKKGDKDKETRVPGDLSFLK